MGTRVERINPYLSVVDLSASLQYYINVLGFELYVETPTLGIVERDGHQIHLSTMEPGDNPQRVWIGVEDIEPLYLQYAANGVTFFQRPTNYSWAYQMTIEDQDKNQLVFGSGPKQDEPFED